MATALLRTRAFLLNISRKTIFYDIDQRIVIYFVLLITLSPITDYKPFPPTYFARRNNVLNQNLVKLAWGWTLLLTGVYAFATSYGEWLRMMLSDLFRLAIATALWYFWTRMFHVIETRFGDCSDHSFHRMTPCITAGFKWFGFDISGHAFMLIFSSLVLIEEARLIRRWEDFKSRLDTMEEDEGAVDAHKIEWQKTKLSQVLYILSSTIIETLFCIICGFIWIWDCMLLATILYFHSTAEKVIGGAAAVLSYFFVYRTRVIPSCFEMMESFVMPLLNQGRGRLKSNDRLATESEVGT